MLAVAPGIVGDGGYALRVGKCPVWNAVGVPGVKGDPRSKPDGRRGAYP